MNLPAIYFLLLWNLAPIRGLATWYDSGTIMRNNEPLDLAAPVVSVDDSHVDWLGRVAVVLTKCGGIYFIRVADTGYLEATRPDENGRRKPQLYQLGISKFTGQLRYWPIVPGATPVLTDTIDWQEEEVHKIVADFPRLFFGRVACKDNDTTEVRMFVYGGL